MSSYDEAFQIFSQGAVDTAREILDASIQQSHASNELKDILSLCCFRATLAAMEGDGNISELLEPASRASGEVHHLLTCYLEGLSAMANGDFEVARLKFEAMKKEYTVDSIVDSDGIQEPGNLSMDVGNERVGSHLAYLGLGAVYFHGKQFKSSFTSYRRVLETLGSSCTPKIVRVGMGLSAFCLHHPSLAKKILERELALHPDNDLALWALLVVYVHLRLLPSVAETVVKLKERLPENLIILIRVADLLYFRAIEEKSIVRSSSAILRIIEHIRFAGMLEEKALADYHEGRILIVLGKFSEAGDCLERAIRAMPSLLPARIHYAHLLFLNHRDTDGARELLQLNREYPNQREVLQLLALHVSERGKHESALQYCRRLVDSVAPGEVRSLALATWCSRLDEKQCLEHHRHLIKVFRELSSSPNRAMSDNLLGATPPLYAPPRELLANVAVLSKDVNALEAIVNDALGASFLPLVLEQRQNASSKSSSPSLPDVPLYGVPLLYNLALLKEENESTRHMAYCLYSFLVKKYYSFHDPYFRLFHISIKDGHYLQGVQWLSLLIWIVEHTEKDAGRKGASTSESSIMSASTSSFSSGRRSYNQSNYCCSTVNLAKSFIGIAFFAHRQHKVAMELLRSGACTLKSARLRKSSVSSANNQKNCFSSPSDIISALFLGVYYLRCAQKQSRDNYRFLTKAKEQFELVLKADQVNLLAAHGLSCCLGLLDDNYHCQSLLLHVSEAKPNRSYVLRGNRSHLANVKVRLDNYKQAIDYLEKVAHRTDAQNSSLAYCYAQISDFGKSQKALLSAIERKGSVGDSSTVVQKEPMLLYNGALIHFTAFLHGVKLAGVTTLSTGLELRGILEKAILMSAQFFSRSPTSEETIQGSGYLKQIGHYCLNIFKETLQPLIAIGIESKKQEDKNAARWADSMVFYRRQIQEQEETNRQVEEAKRKDQLQASAALSENFKLSGFSPNAAMFDPELPDCIGREDLEPYVEVEPSFGGNDEELHSQRIEGNKG